MFSRWQLTTRLQPLTFHIMKRTIIIGLPLVLAVILATTSGSAQPVKSSSTSPTAAEQKAQAATKLRAANDQFYAALNSMFTGDIAPMNAIWSHRDDVTFMGPFGGRLVGWEAVGAEFKREAGLKFGGRVVCKDVLVHVEGDTGYTIGIEEGENMSAEGKPVTVYFRATNIFHVEAGQWRLIHHHTDVSEPLKQAVSPVAAPK
jgi:ketosteroid isomerase-like protein